MTKMAMRVLLMGLATGGIGTAAQTAAPADTAKQIATMETHLADWAQLGRYRAENAALRWPGRGEQRVVFYGDSITDGWGRRPETGEFFPGKPYVNRGISGQTTPQMVVRFRAGCGATAAGGGGDPGGDERCRRETRADDAGDDRGQFPVDDGDGKGEWDQGDAGVDYAGNGYPWKPEVEPVEKIQALNAWLREFSKSEGLVYLDYYSALVDGRGGMREGTSFDGVHPNAAGYAVMGPLAEKAIDQALHR